MKVASRADWHPYPRAELLVDEPPPLDWALANAWPDGLRRLRLRVGGVDRRGVFTTRFTPSKEA